MLLKEEFDTVYDRIASSESTIISQKNKIEKSKHYILILLIFDVILGLIALTCLTGIYPELRLDNVTGVHNNKHILFH